MKEGYRGIGKTVRIATQYETEHVTACSMDGVHPLAWQIPAEEVSRTRVRTEAVEPEKADECECSRPQVARVG